MYRIYTSPYTFPHLFGQRLPSLASRHTVANVDELARRVHELVVGVVEAAESVLHDGDQAGRSSLVTRSLPEERTTEAELLQVSGLQLGAVTAVEGDELLRLRVPGDKSTGGRTLQDGGALLGELVEGDGVVGAGAERALVRLAQSSRVRKGLAVEREAEVDLLSGHALGDVVPDSLVGADGGRAGVGAVGVEVGGVGTNTAPGAGEVVGHDVEHVKTLVNLGKIKEGVVGWAGRQRGGQEVLVVLAEGGSLVVESGTKTLDDLVEVLTLRLGGRELPVEVDTIHAEVEHELDGAGNEAAASTRGPAGIEEVIVCCSTTDGEDGLQLAVLLLLQVKLLDGTVSVVASLGNIAVVRLLVVTPGVGRVTLSKSAQDNPRFSI